MLNHPEQVQPETKTHVLAVMESLNYHPNWFARGLNLGKTSTIALLVPNIESRRYREIMSGVETVALKKQHIVMLCNTHASPEEEAEYLKMVVGRLILASSVMGREQRNALLGPNLPWVHIGPGEPGLCRNLCYINYEEGAYQMTTHLIKMGQKEITLLLDEAPLVEMRQITAGYRRGAATRRRRADPDGAGHPAGRVSHHPAAAAERYPAQGHDHREQRTGQRRAESPAG